MNTANERRLQATIDKQADQITTQEKIIERYQRETADQQRQIEILKGGKR